MKEEIPVADSKEFRDRVKSLWIKGMKAVGNTAASIANNTRYKVDEVTIQNRRREVLNDLAHKTYALWLKGEAFPESMTRMLDELKRLDEQMNDIRAEKYALTNRPDKTAADEMAPDTDKENDEEESDPSSDMTGESPVSAEINELFDGTSSVGKTAEKVNQTLDQMSDRLRRFPQGNGKEETDQRQE